MSQDGKNTSMYSFAFVWEFLRTWWVTIFHRRATCSSTASLEGKTVVITGCNTGIGKATALDLARRGAKVIGGCRDMKKAEEAAKEIRQSVPNAQIVMKQLDLASMASVLKFAKGVLSSEPRIHILINNAGILGCPKSQTEDGFEMHLGVNHIGHFLLTLLLLNRLKESRPARIVNVSALLYRWGYIDFDDINMDQSYTRIAAYCRSKLANILFTRELVKKLKGTGVTTYCLHPGVIKTELTRGYISGRNRILQAFLTKFSSFLMRFAKTPEEGAQTTIYCAVEESLANESGFYYDECQKVDYYPVALNDGAATNLWELSEKLTGITYNP